MPVSNFTPLIVVALLLVDGRAEPVAWTNLLDKLDTEKQAVQGSWRLTGGELIVDAEEGARLALPYQPPQEYDFEVTFTRHTGEHSIALIFTTGSGQATFEIDAWSQHLAGFQLVAGRTIRENKTRANNQRLVNGRKYTLLLQVRKTRVKATVDGKLVSTYEGNGSDLSISGLWRLPDVGSLGLGAWSSSTSFHSVRVQALAGAAETKVAADRPKPASPITTERKLNGFLNVIGERVKEASDNLEKSLATIQERVNVETPSPLQLSSDEGHEKIAVPFFKKHCIRCHGPEKRKGKFRVDQDLPNDFTNLQAKEKWSEVVNVLNSHEMPPEDEPQPKTEDVATVVDWITGQMSRAELHRRDSAIVLRRLNRAEYQNTIRDFIGIDFDPSGFPQDPPAGGFDNNGGALTLSPLLLELYYKSAKKILDQALVEGNKPPSLRWRFEPETGDSDSNRVEYDSHRVIVNGGKNRVENGFKVMHHENWDRGLNARDYAMPYEGDYIIRIRAAGRVPPREDVVRAARGFLEHRMNEQMKKDPAGERWLREQFDRDLKHFQTDRMYDYGSPRLKLIQNLGGTPRVIAEFDIDARLDKPVVYEVQARFTTERAGLTIRYAYDIPKELENSWMQGHDDFARPELWVDWFEIEGPIHPAWPPESHSRILFESNKRFQDRRAYARDVIERFMRRAYRRPVTEAEVITKLALYDNASRNTSSLIEAIKTPLTAVLVSPHFLFLAEPLKAGTPLNDHQLASRLSFFLWSTTPDGELLRLAEAGSLKQGKDLETQVDRMLKDQHSRAFVTNFAGQWLGLREVGGNPPAQDLYPRYDRHLEISIVKESEAFFGEILRNDLSVMNFIKSDFVVINARLARFYGIAGIDGDAFRPVPVESNIHRGGVVTQASVLSITSNGTRTSPVKRGTWVMKNLLGIDPGLPVANAGEIAPMVPGIDKATVRQRLEIHRSLPQCARCHNKIDPLGFALENYNAAGEWREQEGFAYKGRIDRDDPVINPSSSLPDGTKIVGVAGLQEAILKKEDLFLQCLAGKMLTYALGRELGIADRVHVKGAVEHMKQNGRTLRALIKFIVSSEPFRSK